MVYKIWHKDLLLDILLGLYAALLFLLWMTVIYNT